MKTFLRSLVLAAAAVALCAVRPLHAAAEVGQPAPNFTLRDIAGQKHSLSEYRGKTVVLEWNNPDCPIVRKHYESDNLPKLQREATADGIVWLLINSAAPGKEGGDYSDAELKDWLGKHHAAPTAYFRDADGKVGHAYGAKTTPHMFVIDTKGTLVYEGAIDSIPSSDPADIAKAKNYVRAALASLKADQPIQPKATRPYGCSVKYGSKA